MNEELFYESIEENLYATARIEKTVNEINLFTEEPMYNELIHFEGLETLPLKYQCRVKRIIEKKDRARAIYVSLLQEVKVALLDLYNDISTGKMENYAYREKNNDTEPNMECNEVDDIE